MTAEERKARPVATGVLDYFPDALQEVARVSKVGNDQHNPGQPLHWDKSKSTDEADALVRHLMDRGKLDTDGMRHSAKVAWRALALCQREIEKERTAYTGVPLHVDSFCVRNAEQDAIAQAQNVYNACDVEEAIRWAAPADPESIRRIWNARDLWIAPNTRELFVKRVSEEIKRGRELRRMRDKLDHDEFHHAVSQETIPPTKPLTPRKYLVYVSGPYSNPDPAKVEENVRNAEAVAAVLWKWGYSVICPHANTHGPAKADSAIPYDAWLAGDLTQVERSDAVVFLPGWSGSKGTMQEMIHAQNRGIPTLAWTELAKPSGADRLRTALEYVCPLR